MEGFEKWGIGVGGGREGVIYNRDWVTEEDWIGGDLSVLCDQGLGRLAASPVVPYFMSVGP